MTGEKLDIYWWSQHSRLHKIKTMNHLKRGKILMDEYVDALGD